MKRDDPALSISNPRLLAAIYYGLLSVVATILIDAFLVSLGIQEIVPLFQSILLGMIIASATGAIFGEKVVHCHKPYGVKTFWLGFLMVMVSLPFFDLGLLMLIDPNNLMLPTGSLRHVIHSYAVILFYSYFLFGFLLATAAGLASMYLRGQLVYDILHKYGGRKHKTKHDHVDVDDKIHKPHQ